MSPLGVYVLAAMSAWIPPEQHASFEPRRVTEGHYQAIAEDIATAATEFPAVDGEPARTAVLLASIASYESSFSVAVDDCRVRGGTRARPSYSLWQVAGTRADLCASRLAAARIALGIVSASLTACAPRGEPLAIFTVGRCRADEKAHWRLARARRWWTAHPFDAGEPS